MLTSTDDMQKYADKLNIRGMELFASTYGYASAF